MPATLHIFDFDGTVFNSPLDTPENRKKFEKATGEPWLIDKELSRKLSKEKGHFVPMRKGWWGRKETLEPPLVPIPAPKEWFNKAICADFLASKADPEALTLIVTGRHGGLRQQVLRILAEGNLVEVDKRGKEGRLIVVDDTSLYCLGDDGPSGSKGKPAETLDWKVWLCEQFLGLYSDIKKVKFWEDREKHVEHFRSLNGVLAEEVEVHAVV